MKTVVAPGKMVLTGAYAVLEGAPAIVVAVDRYAKADPSRVAESPSAEVLDALGESPAPSCDASALYHEGSKLGLGSSAAVLVASLGADAAKRGLDPSDPDVRSRIFRRARESHARVQGGGSGVDVAASTYGGVLRYTLHANRPWILESKLPEGLVIAGFFSGKSAKTSELLALVAELKERDPDGHQRVFANLGYAAELAAKLMENGSIAEFVGAVRVFLDALDELGEMAEAPIVPLSFKRLAIIATEEGGVFLPSGAGGGDVGVFLGAAQPSENFTERAKVLGMQPLAIGIDRHGLRVSPDSAPSDLN
jgi:phosphomevalonate kinase